MALMISCNDLRSGVERGTRTDNRWSGNRSPGRGACQIPKSSYRKSYHWEWRRDGMRRNARCEGISSKPIANYDQRVTGRHTTSVVWLRTKRYSICSLKCCSAGNVESPTSRQQWRNAGRPYSEVYNTAAASDGFYKRLLILRSFMTQVTTFLRRKKDHTTKDKK